MRFMAARHRSFPGAHRLKGYTMIGPLIASPLVAYGILIDERPVRRPSCSNSRISPSSTI
ncbi:MAG: hypothetical protein R2710_06185 [Acidimicrobiales bacterium]